MFGPVMIEKLDLPCSKVASLAIKATSSCISTHGCRAASNLMPPSPRGRMVGRTYGTGALTETCAKLATTSTTAMRSFSNSIGPQYPLTMRSTSSTTSCCSLSYSLFSRRCSSLTSLSAGVVNLTPFFWVSRVMMPRTLRKTFSFERVTRRWYPFLSSRSSLTALSSSSPRERAASCETRGSFSSSASMASLSGPSLLLYVSLIR
mmetsp:Transcript_25256/g.65982  ORF Transcript_25256/g.65982 Transcript_25256/m.65982 type:complete len:205 (+) Transcript_25256:3436-4050(+)